MNTKVINGSDIETVEIPGSMEDAVLLGIELSQQQSGIQWELGRLAHALFPSNDVIRYEHLTIQSWAAVIGRKTATLTKLRWVASSFSRDEVDSLPNLTISHFEATVSAIKKIGRDQVLAYLAEANKERWSVDKLQQEMIQNGQAETMPITIKDGTFYMKEELDEKGRPTGRGFIGLMVDDYHQWERAAFDNGLLTDTESGGTIGERCKQTIRPLPMEG